MDQERATELAWAAGLFEGEGCFTTNGSNSYLLVEVISTDHDVLETFDRIVGGGKFYRRKSEHDHYKPKWTWRVTGTADALRIFQLLEPWLHERRRARFLEIYRDRCRYERVTRFANRSEASRKKRAAGRSLIVASGQETIC